jgi:hypothetical protein
MLLLFYTPVACNRPPNVAIDLIPLIYPLHRFESVSEYMKYAKKLGQMHYEIFQSIKYKKEN